MPLQSLLSYTLLFDLDRSSICENTSLQTGLIDPGRDFETL